MEKEKREIGMEKIVNLLNEYEVERKDGGRWDILDVAIVEKLRCLAISKSYGFIKWLVENEKIDLDGYPDIDFFNGDVNNLLMYLAIQDEPIEFLISILK